MFRRDLTNKAAVLTLFLALLSAPLAAQTAALDADVQRALADVRSRAAAGDVVAQLTLASILYSSSTDTLQAIEWFRRAAAQQHPDAEFQLGQIHEFGFGVPADNAEALNWYRRAAAHGSIAAMRAVGDFYRRGRGVDADEAEAARWYQRAAAGDDLRAQFQLGQAYFNGTGVQRSYADAYFWFSIAASQTPLLDNQKAFLEMRNVAGARMTPEEEVAAARRAAAWKPSAR